MHLGFVGLGRMGAPMANRLLEAGHDLVVHDIDPVAMDRLTTAGASPAASPADVADRCELILLSLPTPDIVEDVVLGGKGIINGTQVTHVIDLSTTGPPTAKMIATRLADSGVTAVDSPVSGGVNGAVQGTLAVMVACSEQDYLRTEPIITNLGNVFHVGRDPGMGQTMKLVNNYLSAAALATTSEALVVGTKAGLNPRVMLDVINAGSGRNSATQDKFPKAVLTGTFDFGFATGLMEKDLHLFAQAAAGLGIPLQVASAVHQLWLQTKDEQGASSDFTAIARQLESVADTEIRAD